MEGFSHIFEENSIFSSLLGITSKEQFKGLDGTLYGNDKAIVLGRTLYGSTHNILEIVTRTQESVGCGRHP